LTKQIFCLNLQNVSVIGVAYIPSTLRHEWVLRYVI